MPLRPGADRTTAVDGSGKPEAALLVLVSVYASSRRDVRQSGEGSSITASWYVGAVRLWF